MKQDRKTNGWIGVGAFVEILLGLVLICAGAGMSVGGFFYIDKLNKLSDVQFFLNQKWIKFVIDKFKLIPKYTYLYLGIAVAVVGLVTLILGIISCAYAKKHKVVRRRVAITFQMLLALGVVGCAVAYFVMEKDVLTTNIKYVLYGAMGGFGFIALCKLLGVIFGRSEQFMSSDNSKYAKNNRLIGQYASQQRSNAGQGRTVAPNQVQPRQAGVRQASQSNMPRPAGRPVQTTAGTRPTVQGQPRPQSATRTTAGATPNQVRQPSSASGVRPVGATQGQPPRPSGVRYCPKCGKKLNPEEKICSLCGFRVSE